MAAAALGASGLPEQVCRVIAEHQLDDERGTLPTDPLGRALRGGVVLARAVATGDVDAPTTALLATLTAGGADADEVRALTLRTAAEAAGLSAAMG